MFRVARATCQTTCFSGGAVKEILTRGAFAVLGSDTSKVPYACLPVGCPSEVNRSCGNAENLKLAGYCLRIISIASCGAMPKLTPTISGIFEGSSTTAANG